MISLSQYKIQLMPHHQARAPNPPLNKCMLKICPYCSKPFKCAGYYDGTAMCSTTMANVRCYVVKQVETLLSGRPSEELGIITFNPHAEKLSITTIWLGTNKDPDTTAIISQYPTAFPRVVN